MTSTKDEIRGMGNKNEGEKKDLTTTKKKNNETEHEDFV